MSQRQRKPGVFGPYEHRSGQWRVVFREEGGAETKRTFPTKEEAEKQRKQWLGVIAEWIGVTVEKSIDAYEIHLRQARGNRKGSANTTVYRVRYFFRPWLVELLEVLTPAKCEKRYAQIVTEPSEHTGKPLAPDTHRNTLAEAKTFAAWCVGKGWLRSNPLEAVEGQGKRKHGKEQLRINEARLWLGKALEHANHGEPGAVAAMISLVMGMRCSEIVSRVVRDLDDDGQLLWIPCSKTPAGRRTLEVPPLLQQDLKRLCRDKLPEAPLFGHHWRDWPRKWVQRICREVGVPKVSAHAMRGLHATLALGRGTSPHAVAASLGHASPTVTMQSYADPSAVAAANQRHALTILVGGISKAGELEPLTQVPPGTTGPLSA